MIIISLTNYLIIGAILFGLGMAGTVINRNNLISILMCVELMLLAVNTNFIAFSYYHNDIAGQIFVFFILAVAAAEAAIGLAIVTVLFRHRKTVDVTVLDTLKG
jgi:NADH-quinone oxidoreductase subunit K